MNRPLALLATGTVALPTMASLAVLPESAIAASTKEYRGAPTSNRWGRYQVVIDVRGKKIVSLRASYPTDKPRSKRINSRAIPTLRSETLRAQSARIRLVSGATMTSRSFISSLQSALRAAHL